jgi:hypothetical protein
MTMESILKYLELPWAESVLHHEELINKVKINKYK